jgi:hypothetical protein
VYVAVLRCDLGYKKAILVAVPVPLGQGCRRAVAVAVVVVLPSDLVYKRELTCSSCPKTSGKPYIPGMEADL